MLSFLIFLFILGLLIIVHELGHFLVARSVGVRVETFSLGFGRQLLTKKKSGTEYTISAIPLGGFVKLAGDNLAEYQGRADEYLSKSPGERARIVFAGPILNYILGFLFFWLIFFVGYPTLTTKVGGLLDGFGAKDAGMQVGDKIIAVDGQRVEYWEDLQKIIQRKKPPVGVKLSLLRNNRELTLDVDIREQKLEDALGQKRSVGLLGITPFDEIITVRHGLAKSFLLSINKTWDLTELTYRALWRMVTGKMSMKESVTGPLGIFYITSRAAKLGIIAVLHLVAVLSMSLCIFNLLPLPVLDGGHIFLLAIEKIRGRHFSLKAEQIVNRIGITVITSLAILVTYNDIVRYFGDKIVQWFR
ncbi:MAG: RIP metalloprotease RseP [Candidatus Omnitrophica bacterium]|nr:RIP metalloprotease RseP [Candidatus Omnitrophota bacterium]